MPEMEAIGGAAGAMALTDEEVVRRVLDGDGALFEVLMRRYNQRLYRVARGILKDESQAEDVIQQAYVNAYFHLHQFPGRGRHVRAVRRLTV